MSSNKTMFKAEHGFKRICREGEDPLDTKNIPLRKKRQKGGPNVGKRKQIADATEVGDVQSISVNQGEISSGDKIACEVSTLDSYIHLLKCGHINVTNETLTCFVVPDYDYTRFVLKEDSYHIVSRETKRFADTTEWVYSCTCDKYRQDLLYSLSDRVITAYKEFNEMFSQCLHCQAVMTIMRDVDSYYDIFPEICRDHDYTEKKSSSLEVKEAFILNPNLLFINLIRNPGIVKVVNSFIRCLTCKSTTCLHVKASETLDHPEQDEQLRSWMSNKKLDRVETRPTVKTLSCQKIPFVIPDTLQAILTKPYEERFTGWSCYIVKPSVCISCNEDNFLEKKLILPVMTESMIHSFKVNNWMCRNCSRLHSFDGSEYGVLNMGSYCVAYEVLRRFLFYFLQGKSTMYTEYVALRRIYIDHGHVNVDEVFTYQKLKDSWYAFLDLIDINFEEGFKCEECGPEPHTIVIDATTLSFRKQMLSWGEVFGCVDKTDKKVLKGRNQVLFVNPECRRGLSQLGANTMIQEELKSFATNLSEEETCLKSLLCQLQEENKGKKIITCSKELSMFLKALSSQSPACGLVDSSGSTKCLLTKLANISRDALLMGELQHTFPIVFNVIRVHGDQYTGALIPIMSHIVNRIDAPFTSTAPLDISVVEAAEEPLAYFPSLPKLRERGTYEADLANNNNKKLTCRKRTHGHPSLLPGLFTLLCPHGVCYGFQVMTVAESPNVPFTVLRTRFSKAPNLVIYDNACNLHKYCLNRDPHFFRSTLMKVDGVHWANHQGCSGSYELKSYPQYSNLNSQVVEQFNSQIKKLKGSISYMTRDNFFKHLKLFVWAKNNKVLGK